MLNYQSKQSEAKPRILIVDDHPIIRQVVEKRIKKLYGEAIEVATAINGLDAVETVKQAYQAKRPFACIFMDYNMPQMDGLQAATHIVKFAAPQKPNIYHCTANPNDLETAIKKSKLASPFKGQLNKKNGVDTNQLKQILQKEFPQFPLLEQAPVTPSTADGKALPYTPKAFTTLPSLSKTNGPEAAKQIPTPPAPAAQLSKTPPVACVKSTASTLPKVPASKAAVHSRSATPKSASTPTPPRSLSSTPSTSPTHSRNKTFFWFTLPAAIAAPPGPVNMLEPRDFLPRLVSPTRS